MHQDILIQVESADIIPTEDLVLRKHVIIPDNFFLCHTYLLIYVICNHHIHLGISIYKPFYCFQNLHQRIFVHPVIAVHNFKIVSRGMGKSAVDCISVPAVFFIDCFDNCRILRGIALRNFLCPVF